MVPEARQVHDLAARLPGSILGSMVQAYPLTGGGHEVRLDPSEFHEQYPDLKPREARLLGRIQRPVTDAARTEAQAAAEPAWHTFPTWHVFGDADRASCSGSR